jgi:hypothetical protein
LIVSVLENIMSLARAGARQEGLVVRLQSFYEIIDTSTRSLVVSHDAKWMNMTIKLEKLMTEDVLKACRGQKRREKRVAVEMAKEVGEIFLCRGQPKGCGKGKMNGYDRARWLDDRCNGFGRYLCVLRCVRAMEGSGR